MSVIEEGKGFKLQVLVKLKLKLETVMLGTSRARSSDTPTLPDFMVYFIGIL
jgi:hypothetical protein